MNAQRNKLILNAIVEDYIVTAGPVGSKAVAKKYGLSLSPATIRAVMAELEFEGYLAQPHTSAGRIPTEKGFRAYINGLIKREEPLDLDKALIKRTCRENYSRGVIAETAKTLSTLTNCAGIMFLPRLDAFIVKQINIVPLDRTGLLVVLVSNHGMAQTRFIRMDIEVRKLDLKRITEYLNSIAKGLDIRTLRSRIVEQMRLDKNLYDTLLSNALSVGAKALEDTAGKESNMLFVEGTVRMLDQPEFRDDLEKMRRIFQAFETKSTLIHILDRAMAEQGAHVYLGSESNIKDFEGLSLVTAPYGAGGEILGTLGVIGPLRMNYSKIIPLVDYTAEQLSTFFSA